MMTKLIRVLFFLLPFLIFQPAFCGQGLIFQGQLSGWASRGKNAVSTGIRYLPEISLNKEMGTNFQLDSDISFNANQSWLFHSVNDVETTNQLEPYRLWLRFSSTQFEARLGLQKLSFGSASLLRSLMWFDRLDPRDPLQLTNGVYGLLLRYYFLNNTNIWVWGLYGNDDPKGLEFFGTKKGSPEYGGRLQAPVLAGDIGFTFHHRRAVLPFTPFGSLSGRELSFPENRFALDGRWDFLIGLWFEAAMIHQKMDFLSSDYRRLLTLGTDFTFPLGNGLHLLSEHFMQTISEEPFSKGNNFSISAALFNYPLGLLDTFTAIFYYDWENRNLYRFLNWQRSYDNWQFYLIGFWNPENINILQNLRENNFFAGRGFQLMVVFNH